MQMRNRTPEELKELRQKTGLSIAEVCRLTGVDRSTWERWEMGAEFVSSRRPSALAFSWLNIYLEKKELEKKALR
jgi:transcriptional regulator with XRE-family HTH domain